MWLVIIEALIALALLLFVVWWTMFHGRRQGERPGHGDHDGHDGRDGPSA